MNIEDYGLSFDTNKQVGLLALDEYLTDFYEDVIKNQNNRYFHSLIRVHWHKKYLMHIRVQVSPSTRTVIIKIHSNLFYELAEEPRKALEEALPPLTDRGKALYGRIYMGK